MVTRKTWSFKMAFDYWDFMGKIPVFWIVGNSVGCGHLQVVKNNEK